MATEKVRVCIPKNGDDDVRVEVGLNGKMFVIKRGEEVLVEPEVFEILVHANLAAPEGGGRG